MSCHDVYAAGAPGGPQRPRTIHADIHTRHRRLERIIPRSRVREVWSGSSASFASGHCTLDDLARTLAALSLRAESIRCMQIKDRRCSPARGLPIRSWPAQQTRLLPTEPSMPSCSRPSKVKLLRAAIRSSRVDRCARLAKVSPVREDRRGMTGQRRRMCKITPAMSTPAAHGRSRTMPAATRNIDHPASRQIVCS